MGYSINKMIVEIKKRGNIMAGLAKEFEQLGCWESATEEENIVIYGMDFEDEKVFIVFTDDMGKTPVDAKASLVAACYSEDDCFYWEKPLSMQKLLLLPPANICATNTTPARLHCCMLWKSMNYLKIKLTK